MKVINKHALNKKNIVVMLPEIAPLQDFGGSYHKTQPPENRG